MNPEDAIYGSSTSRPAPPLQGTANGPHFGTGKSLPALHITLSPTN